MDVAKQERNRIAWVDTAKGIGIILVVIAHTSFDYTWAGKFINSFHMPLFFFLSGYFFSADKYPGFRALWHKKSTTILRPYFIFAALSFLYFLARYYFGDPNYFMDLNVYREFFGIFYSAGTKEWMDFNLPLWFLTCLFVVELLYYAICKVFRNKLHIAAILVICSLIGYADGIYNPYKLPWGIDVAITAIVFYGAGHLLRPLCQRVVAKPTHVKWPLAIALLAMNLFLLQNTVNVNMKLHGDYYDFYLFSFSGITACILFSSLIRFRMLQFAGENALIFMALHIPLLHLAAMMAPSGIFRNVYNEEALLIAVTLLALIPVSYLINRYFPYILGKPSKRIPRMLLAVDRRT